MYTNIKRGAVVVLIVIVAAMTHSASAIDTLNPAVHCEKDTAEITAIVRKLNTEYDNAAERRMVAANMLKGRTHDTSETQDSTGVVRINIDTFTSVSYINTVEALTRAAGQSQPSWIDFAREYENLSCRRGEDSGFASVLRYGCDWISDNIYRGNIKELTENYPGAVSKIKSVDYMSRNPEKFAALSNPEIFDKIELLDMGFKQHRLPYLKRQYISRKDIVENLKDGDIIMMLTNADGLDIYAIYFVTKENEKIYLTGLNPETGEIETLKEPADRVFKTLAAH
ncbi:MAG: DUF1460 domain-containing protein, partial [Muribaculaceae bacterium]|nr:DUF1460 domain-containing protein [Muribaculaceae bacterium]